MELLFQNSHIRDKEFFKEFGFYTFFKRPIAMLFNIFAIACIVANVPFLFLREDRGAHVYMIFMSMAIIFVGVFGYLRYVKTWYSREVEANGTQGAAVYTIEVYPDKLIHSSTRGTVQELELSQIKRVIKTKSYICLMSKANLLYVFNKNGFSIGTMDEFKSFLKAKNLCK